MGLAARPPGGVGTWEIAMDLTTTQTLNNGVAIPQLGLGVYRSPNGAETVETVRYALQHGLSLIHI